MADADVPVTAGSGTKIDTRTVGAGVDEHRQVVVVGDPATAAGVASADATNGLDVDVTRVSGVVDITPVSPLATDYLPVRVTDGAGFETRPITYRGRANTFRIPGRVATTQNLLSLHNATGSTIKVRVTQAWLDFSATVVKAVTVLPPVLRLHKVTVLPTNGTALTKVPQDSTQTSSASVTLLGDASADGTGSTTTLTATIPAGAIYTQEFVARLITAAGYEPMDRVAFLEGDATYITLNALEGIVLQLVSAVNMVATDMYVAGVEWEEAATA